MCGDLKVSQLPFLTFTFCQDATTSELCLRCFGTEYFNFDIVVCTVWQWHHIKQKPDSLQYNTASPRRRCCPEDLYPCASARCALRHRGGTVGHELCVILVNDLERKEGRIYWHCFRKCHHDHSVPAHNSSSLPAVWQGSIQWLIILFVTHISTLNHLPIFDQTNAECWTESTGLNTLQNNSAHRKSPTDYWGFLTLYVAPSSCHTYN